MSGSDDEARQLLAGEYVLGTLPADERARADAEAARDPALRDAIAGWEDALFPLALLVPPVTPPIGLWSRIERSVIAPGVRAAPSLDRPRRPELSTTFWKGVTAASFLLAAGIAFVVLMDQVPMAVPVAVLEAPGRQTAAFVVESRSDGVVEVLPLRPGPVPSDRDLELWSLADGATTPKSLGVLPLSGRHLHGAMLPRGASRLLVSLEPRGGSPTGLPTGPVLFGGALVLPD